MVTIVITLSNANQYNAWLLPGYPITSVGTSTIFVWRIYRLAFLCLSLIIDGC